ncbi:MAG: SAM-dependent methyltransferase [Chitinophagaceae bacterium]|nr:MAG: SAM-dependent methyltransferase [Chitinophagaceae bacterium]
MENKLSHLYIIPSFLSTENTHIFPESFIKKVISIRHFFVENERSARRFLKTLDKSVVIDNIRFMPVNDQENPDLNTFKEWLTQEKEVGIISEAGYPCVADPGNILIKAAHQLGAKVIPLVGPNAMIMALAASGFNGQRFAFSGYLPVKMPARVKTLKELEKKLMHTGETQIFMETPYRNNALIKDVIENCMPQTLFCIAADITGPTEFIKTQSIKNWKQSIPDLNKRPAVFLLGK